MKSKFFFDYIYYRITNAYLEWEGSGGYTTGIISVTWIQSFIFGSVLGVTVRTFFDRSETAPYAKAIAVAWVLASLCLYVWNHSRYNECKYNTLKEYWKHEPPNERRLKGFLVALSIILPIVPMILMGIFW